MLVKHGRALERSLMLLDIGEHPQRRHQNALRLLLAHWPTAPALGSLPTRARSAADRPPAKRSRRPGSGCCPAPRAHPAPASQHPVRDRIVRRFPVSLQKVAHSHIRKFQARLQVIGAMLGLRKGAKCVGNTWQYARFLIQCNRDPYSQRRNQNDNSGLIHPNLCTDRIASGT